MDIFGMYGARDDDEDVDQRDTGEQPVVQDESPAEPARSRSSEQNRVPTPQPRGDDEPTEEIPVVMEAEPGGGSEWDSDWDAETDAAQENAPEPDWHEVELPEQVSSSTSQLVRPYARTGGRTRSDIALSLEALILTTASGRDGTARLPAEQTFVCHLCHTPQSVAEISAHIHLPIGVTRIIISDMISAGLVAIASTTANGERPPMELMQRVLHALRHA